MFFYYAMVDNIDVLIVQMSSDLDPFKAEDFFKQRLDLAIDFYERFKPSKVVTTGGVSYLKPGREGIVPESFLLARHLVSRGVPNVESQVHSGDTWTDVVFTHFNKVKPLGLEKPVIGIIGSHKYHSLANMILRDDVNIHLLNNEKMSFLRDDLMSVILDTSFIMYGAKERNPESHLRAIHKYHPEIGENPMKFAPYYAVFKTMKALNSYSLEK